MSEFLTRSHVPTGEVKAHSPLAHAPGGIEVDRLTLIEAASKGHLVLRGNADILTTPVEQVCAVSFPGEPMSSSESEDRCIRWISPDEYLLTAPVADVSDLESKLRETIDGHHALVDVTGGQTIIHLSGEGAETVLRKSSNYDFHPRNFGLGKVVTTNLAHSQALIRRTGDQAFELIIRRSFADYLWRWLLDAGREFF